jgi:hypothetical protein
MRLFASRDKPAETRYAARHYGNSNKSSAQGRHGIAWLPQGAGR